jgi:hypothetical protein
MRSFGKHLGPLAVLLLICTMSLLCMVQIACDQSQYHKAAQAAAAVSDGLAAIQAENEVLYRTGYLSA